MEIQKLICEFLLIFGLSFLFFFFFFGEKEGVGVGGCEG